MKKTILMTLSMLLLSTAALSAQIDQIANKLVRKAEKVQTAVDDLQFGHGSKREVKQTIRDLKTVLTRLEDKLTIRPMPRPRPNPRPAPIPRPRPMPRPNISASCELDVDGNFFFPDSQIKCHVYGKRAAGYEVKVISEYGARTEFHGTLDPKQSTQYFESKEKRVGGHGVRYEVFILTKTGNRILVDTL